MDNHTKTGTIGGTLFAILLSIDGQELLNVAVKGAIGALAGLGVTLIYKLIAEKLRK